MTIFNNKKPLFFNQLYTSLVLSTSFLSFSLPFTVESGLLYWRLEFQVSSSPSRVAQIVSIVSSLEDGGTLNISGYTHFAGNFIQIRGKTLHPTNNIFNLRLMVVGS